MTPVSAGPPTVATPIEEQLTAGLHNERIVLLGTEVEDKTANRICTQLMLLSAEDPRRDIGLYINSPGGSVLAGLAIYDVMQLIPNDVITVVLGQAASMGQFLLCAGTKGKRFAMPHAQILMHQGSAGLGGTAADVEIYAGQLGRIGTMMSTLIAKHTGQTVQTITDDGRRDRWFSAEEALRYGMVDHLVERIDDVRPAGSRHRMGM